MVLLCCNFFNHFGSRIDNFSHLGDFCDAPSKKFEERETGFDHNCSSGRRMHVFRADRAWFTAGWLRSSFAVPFVRELSESREFKNVFVLMKFLSKIFRKRAKSFLNQQYDTKGIRETSFDQK